jgi:protease stability complex PrcB-like protein
MKSIKKILCFLMTTALLLTSFTSALAYTNPSKHNNGNSNGNGHSVIQITDYTINYNQEANNSQLGSWINNNYQSEGVHYTNINNRDYILISAGKCYNSKCKFNIKNLHYIKNRRHTLYVDYELDISKNSTNNSISNYSYVVLSLNSNFKFHDITNLSHKINIDYDDDDDDDDDYEDNENDNDNYGITHIKNFDIYRNYKPNSTTLRNWVNKYYKTKGTHYINYNNNDYLLISADRCNTSGYSINVKDIYLYKYLNKTLYVDYNINEPYYNSNTNQVINYPYVFIQLNTNYKFEDVIDLHDEDQNNYEITYIDEYDLYKDYTPSTTYLRNWVNKYYRTKGTHYINYNNNDYLLISAGRCNTSGYSIDVNDIYLYKDLKETLYVDYDINEPSSNTNTNQVITYPYVFIRLNTNYKFNNIINLYIEDDEKINYITQYTAFNKYIPDNKTLKEWVYKYYKYAGVRYININNEDYVLISTGKKNTTGYSIIIKDIYFYNDSENILHVEYGIQKPCSNKMNLNITNYPFILVKLNTDYNFNKAVGSIKEIEKKDLYKCITINQLKSLYTSSSDENGKNEILEILLEIINEFSNN